MAELTKEQLEKKQLANECMEESMQRLLEGKLRAAEEITVRAKNIYEELSDKHNLAMALNRLSIVYGEMGNESLDLEYLLDAIEIADGSDDFTLEAKLHNNLGSRFMEIGADERALECFREAHAKLEKACKKDPDILGKNYSLVLVMNLNFATIYSKRGEFAHAKRHLDFAKEACSKNVDTDLIFVYMCFEGLTLWKIGEHDKARELVSNIIKTAEETDYTTDYFEVMTDLLELLKAMGDFENWDKILKIMEARLDEKTGINVRQATLMRRLDYYKTIGDEEKYKEGTAEYYELSLKKAEADNKKKVEMIELQLGMRRAAKQKKHVDRIAYMDPLTGTGNRNRLLEDSKFFVEESFKQDYPITVGLIDIDFFKECNDTYGHIKGDECLKTVAEIIKEAVGNKGKVYRYGGDEFLLLLPELKDEAVEEIGKRIKVKLEEAAIPNEKSAVAGIVTVSQGYAEAIAEPGDTIESLISLADRVLYSVKRRGRNNYNIKDYSEILKEF